MKITPAIQEFSGKHLKSQHSVEICRDVFLTAFILKHYNLAPEDVESLTDDKANEIGTAVKTFSTTLVEQSGMPNGLVATINAFKDELGAELYGTLPPTFIEARYEEFVTEQFIKAVRSIAATVMTEFTVDEDNAIAIAVTLCQARIQGLL